MNIYLLAATFLAVVFGTSISEAGDFPKWPVKNGDFMLSQGWGTPTDWNTATNSGKHVFKMRPPGEIFGTAISCAVIETVESGSAYYYQTVHLMKGKYRASVDICGSDGAQAQLTISAGSDRFASELTKVSVEHKMLQVEFTSQGRDTAISIMSVASAGQGVEFRDVRIDAVSLDSAPVPVEGGRVIGGIVLPENPSASEQYAAYELQRCISKMTGLTPGLKGRDKVFDGRLIYIGRGVSDQSKKLKGLQSDSYMVESSGDRILLAGKDDHSTLYAVYDFLSQQGCRWVVPGEIGEIIPQRNTLVKIKSKVETPDYECRGSMVLAQDFFPGGGEEFGWIAINVEDYFDWFLRNRLNAIWFAGQESYDLASYGAFRGHSWVQRTGHSYGGLIAPASVYFKDHPDWYPLLNGKRTPMCDVGPKFPNQLCVSSKSLRDYTVALVLDYFKNNPDAKAFPMNPMDGPSCWCECDECKKLDPPGIDWSKNASEGQVTGMTDRAVNYANEVADRVAKVYPDKLIEMYGYGYTLSPPVREKVHKNVFIKYANLSGGRGTGPLGPSIMDSKIPIWNDWRKKLDGWKKADARLGFYNYLEWEHPDVSLFWFSNSADVLKHLNRNYNCRILMGETENNILTSPMLYNIIARTVWDVDTDYKAVIKDLCSKFYGPAGDLMYKYNMMMDDATVKSTAWKDPDWRPNNHVDIPLDTMEKGRLLLDEATGKVKGDKMLSKRIAYARFGLAYLTYVSTLNQKVKTPRTADIARKVFDHANALRLEYGIMTKLPTVQQLKVFYYPPVSEGNTDVMQLPDLWQFKKDPDDTGSGEKWYRNDDFSSWSVISTNQDWTAQDAGRGYHGVGWYYISFKLPDDIKQDSRLLLHFGAVDGYADVFLDGSKIGEQKIDVGVMWDKPFEIALPSKLDPAKTHQLVVRVKKETFAAGIWQGVKIIRTSSL